MSLRVYNTLSREKEPFAPIVDGHVGIYLCGPTVYKPPHLGHLVGPVIFDTIKRYLVFKGYAVNWVVNVTDVDDKIIAEADRRGMTFKALAEEQTRLYFAVLDRLNVRSNVDHFPRASEHMAEIISMIETLIVKGHAYATDHGDVWFDTASDPDYGKLSNRKLADAEAGQRDLAGSGKKQPSDFALWKATKPAEPSWPSPWGNGRPGWHIECSAMSRKYLGDAFDIHGGGDDLKFPHHENELAQSECAHGHTFVKYWLHNGLTKIKTKAAGGDWKSEKMSKSLGNTIDAQALLAAHGPDVLRYLLLSTHYRSPIEFSDEAIDNTKKAFGVFTRLIERTDKLTVDFAANEVSVLSQPFEDKFVTSMDDDFNTAGAIGALHELAGAINGEIEKTKVETTHDADAAAMIARAAARFKALTGLLGLTFAPPEKSDDGLADPLMQLIIKLRAEARQKKDFATADAIRDGLNELKITLEDKKDGTVWRQG